MNADQVRALVAAKYPQAMQSPLSQFFSGVVARDEADSAISFAGIQAKVTFLQDKQMRAEALNHALSCIDACEAAGVEYDEETIGHNIECNFPDIEPDECDDIARAALSSVSDSKRG